MLTFCDVSDDMEQISVSPFLNVFFVLERSPPFHGAALLLSAITLDFSTYSYFRHFGLNHYGVQTLLLPDRCGTRSASVKEMHMHLSETTP